MNAHSITRYQMIRDGILTPVQVLRLSYDHNFPLRFIDKLCAYLHCQPGDSIAYIPEKEEDNTLNELMADM